VETIGSKRSYALTWCMPNNGDDDDDVLSHGTHSSAIFQNLHWLPKFKFKLATLTHNTQLLSACLPPLFS